MKTIAKFIYLGLASITFTCVSLSPTAKAVVPPPDGAYPNFTTAEGQKALQDLTSGEANTALGAYSLFGTNTGSFNTAVGAGALDLNTTGTSNTGVGTAALLLNTTNSNNTAVGVDALLNNGADENTAIGFFALEANTIGGTLEIVADQGIAKPALGSAPIGGPFEVGPNTAIGSHALESNVDGSGNTAVGYNALHSQVNGLAVNPHLAVNTAVGFEALANVTGLTTGNNAFNTAIGYQGLFDLTDGETNIAVGALAGRGLTSGTGNIYIGAAPGNAAEDFHTYIANIQFTGVSGAGTDTVTIDLTTGLLGILTSSRRYKEDIKPMNKASEALYRLNPVTYRYKKDVDKTESLAFGLIAEDVAEVNPDLVANNAQGQPESVHYEMVNAMLLNEFLKEHKKVEAQRSKMDRQEQQVQTQEVTIAELKSTVAQQQKQIEALTAGLQKVSAQLELSKSAPQTVLNTQ